MIDFEAGNNNIPEGIQVLFTTATLNEIDFFKEYKNANVSQHWHTY